MGARQSKRSVDITTTPKKEGLPVEGVVGDAAAPGDGKLEKIEETDAKPTTNGVAPHTDSATEDKDKDKDEATEKEKEKDAETKAEDAKVESPTTEAPAEAAVEVTTPTDETAASPTAATSPDSKETKKKDKLKKKWSFRSISFGKKDKSKPAREDAPKNGDVTKEEPLAEGGEEAENGESSPSCPTEDKSSSPVSPSTEKEERAEVMEATPEGVAPEEKKSPSKGTSIVGGSSSPVEEKKDEKTTSSTSVSMEANKVEDNEKQVESAKADKKVEVSQVKKDEKMEENKVKEKEKEEEKEKKNIIDVPVEVSSMTKQKNNTEATTGSSMISRKTSEDIPSQFPSSPPPTPIDPSPLQKAQQVAANATALAEALKLPAEAADTAAAKIISDKASGQKNSIVDTQIPTTPISQKIETKETAVTDFSKITDKSYNSDIILSHEQKTGNAYPGMTKIDFENDEIVPSKEIIATDINLTKNVMKDVENCDTVEKKMETIESVAPMEKDLVLRTEEGPLPISEGIIVEAKPAVVISDNPLENEKIVETLMEVDPSKHDFDSSMKNIESSEGLLEKTNVDSEIVETVSEPIVPTLEPKGPEEEINEKDVPPPLPDSPIPLPKMTSQLLNFMTTQIEDSSFIPEVIENSTNLLPSDCLISSENIESAKTVDKPEEIRESCHNDQIDEKSTTDCKEICENVKDVTPQTMETVKPEALREDEISEEILVRSNSNDENVPSVETDRSNEENLSTISSTLQIATEMTASLLTPPRSPSNVSNFSNNTEFVNTCEASTKESISLLEISEDQSNREFKMESLEQSLNSYNDSELELKDRLAESMEDNEIVNCQLTKNDIVEEKNDQSKIEPEAPVENNIVPNDVGTTEVNDEAPKSAPPAVPAEVPAPTLGPAITEDVASVTKAIEEIDINEKAFAAAVMETIESVNTNEIVTDMNHQNNMNE